MRYYGILLERLAYKYVNGFGYKTAVPVADEEVPARFQRAEEVFAASSGATSYASGTRPSSLPRSRPTRSCSRSTRTRSPTRSWSIPTRCRNHHVEMIYQHMRHTGAAIVPMGDFLAHVGDWTACRRPSSSASCGGGARFRRGVR